MRIPRMFPMLAPALLTIAAGGALALGQSSQPVPDAVEEDWQLVVATPDVLGNGPQITTCMSPVIDGSTPFVAFDMNYREYPTFQPGGMQVQVWSGNQVAATASQGSTLFNTPNETITWTQRMSVANGTVTYQVENGQSTTWGKFGQGSQLTVSFASSLTSMGGYSPSLSVVNSGVSWESNMVSSMALVQVRYYVGGQLIATDTTQRPITLNP